MELRVLKTEYPKQDWSPHKSEMYSFSDASTEYRFTADSNYILYRERLCARAHTCVTFTCERAFFLYMCESGVSLCVDVNKIASMQAISIFFNVNVWMRVCICVWAYLFILFILSPLFIYSLVFSRLPKVLDECGVVAFIFKISVKWTFWMDLCSCS